jgi:CHAT domain-containing protein/Tfp pilus assembly protein PilF
MKIVDFDHEILTILKSGSKEEIGQALTALSRLKDPKYNELLKDIMNSADPVLAVMAAYALGEAGDKAGFAFLEGILRKNPTMFVPIEKLPDPETLQEILKICDDLNATFDFYNSSHFIEAKNKMLRMLDIYGKQDVMTGVGYFDDLLSFSFKKTKGMLLDALAICEIHLGNVARALSYSMEAIGIAEEVEDPQLSKIAYADLGYIHMSIGNYYSALDLLHKSLEIDDGSHDPWRKKNRILSNLSHLYYQVGMYDKALEYGQEALQLSEKENDLSGMARCLNALGVIFSSINELQDAEQCFRDALHLAADKLHDSSLQGIILNNLAYIHFSGSSEIGKAKEYLTNALTLAIQVSNKATEGNVRSSMAMLAMEEGEIDNARFQAEAALRIYREIHSPAGQSEAQFLLGSIEDFFNDDTIAAYEYYKEAIKLTENMRENLLLDDFKISFAVNHFVFYQQMVSLCIRMGKTGEAFEYVERAKSRAFVDMLSSTSNVINAKELPPEQLEQIAHLKGRLNVLRKQISASYADVNKDSSDIRREDINAELIDLEGAYLRTFDELKRQDPEYLSLVAVEVTDIASLQSKLNEKTVLLELYQVQDELFIIVIQHNKPPFPMRITLDIENESDKLFSLFMTLSNGCSIDTRSHEYIGQVRKPLSHFYELLISPVQEFIKGAEHLIIVPHNFWHYLPFQALFDSKGEECLIDKYSLSYAPSSTALTLCSQRKSQYETALLLANPSGDLPYAEEEAERIQLKFGNKGILFKREQAAVARLSEYREADIIHFACHGYFRGDEPLFSHLILADADNETSPFFLPDIFNLRLKASLVTLSACETGLNQFTAGDELIGISRAFFYAGTSALLTSLWAINDKSTAMLMDRFYEGLLNRNESKAGSLRSAILELKAMPEYSHPYFWASFFLSGDWR